MNVRDYVRTKNGIIGRIESKNFIGYNDWIIDTLYYNDDEIIDDWTCGIKEYDVIKSSPNIIDLIEVGDYVNGSKVVDISIIGKDKEKWLWVEQMEDTDNKYGDDYVSYNNDQIKSIITREMFESMEYKVGE